MKNWLPPVILLGLSGLGLMCASQRGQEGLRTFFERLGSGENPLEGVNRFFEDQLDSLQATLDRLADALADGGQETELT